MDEYYRRVDLQITIDEFSRLPRNSAFRYEFIEDHAVLTPRPRAFHCVRDLLPISEELSTSCTVEPLHSANFPGLKWLFMRSVGLHQPFASLPQNERESAAISVLERSARGEDGPIIQPACFQIPGEGSSESPRAAVIVTLVPLTYLTDPYPHIWTIPPPIDAIEKRLGVPHLTWVMVSEWEQRRGLGSRLLSAAMLALAKLGFQQIVSTFLLDNGPSALWHWRHGFQLRPQFSLHRQNQDARSK